MLEVHTRARTEFVPLSDRIRSEAAGLLASSGVLHLYVPHTTAGICVNEGFVGTSTLVPVRNSKLRLGRWQEIFFCEFDGPRHRTVELTFLPG
ncbi:MAG: YjbQ family protein [Candidatus Eisenbacteria bacterium]|uniref:YjbQ family protein n=1 Tax=Eiseniibacteriota bacterium TaxID=2212470 RepID=A0A538TN52_UNCEI|nr:MAG: YjbQ family protein [Candidatus Eisenbacteria bacterium]